MENVKMEQKAKKIDYASLPQEEQREIAKKMWSEENKAKVREQIKPCLTALYEYDKNK